MQQVNTSYRYHTKKYSAYRTTVIDTETVPYRKYRKRCLTETREKKGFGVGIIPIPKYRIPLYGISVFVVPCNNASIRHIKTPTCYHGTAHHNGPPLTTCRAFYRYRNTDTQCMTAQYLIHNAAYCMLCVFLCPVWCCAIPDTRYHVQRTVHTTDAIVRNTEKIRRQYRYLCRYSIFLNTEKYRNKIPRIPK